MYSREVTLGAFLITEDEEGDEFYVVQSAEFDILKKQEDGSQKVVAHLGKGATVGEAALMYNIGRTASLKCTRGGRVWAMDSDQFRSIRKIISELSKKRIIENEQLINQILIFSQLAGPELRNA